MIMAKLLRTNKAQKVRS